MTVLVVALVWLAVSIPVSFIVGIVLRGSERAHRPLLSGRGQWGADFRSEEVEPAQLTASGSAHGRVQSL